MSAKKSTAAKKSAGFSAEEKAAMKERARELKAEAQKADGERDILAKIADMPQPDRGMAERIHALVTANAPDLMPKTWYGMPAYARDGKVVCFQVRAASSSLRGTRPSVSRKRPRSWTTARCGRRPLGADEARLEPTRRRSPRPASRRLRAEGWAERGEWIHALRLLPHTGEQEHP